MKYLHCLNLNAGDFKERKIYICASAVDYFRSHRINTENAANEYTSLYSNVLPVEFIIKAAPDILNQVTFDGLFFKIDAIILNRGNQERFKAFINPDNIFMIDETLPNTCTVNFQGGKIIIIDMKIDSFISLLIEHSKKYRERKNFNYGKNEKTGIR